MLTTEEFLRAMLILFNANGQRSSRENEWLMDSLRQDFPPHVLDWLAPMVLERWHGVQAHAPQPATREPTFYEAWDALARAVANLFEIEKRIIGAPLILLMRAVEWLIRKAETR